MSVELKPCPFCGGEAQVTAYETESLWSSEQVTYTKVSCDECDIAFQTEPGHEVQATAAWNRRDRQLSQASHGAVRALEWTTNWGVTKAESPIGHYFIAARRDGGFDCRLEDHWNTWASSEATAKVAAQADYERRVLASLEPAAPGREEAIPLGESHDAELSICRALDCLRNDLTQEAFEQLNDALIAVRSSPPTGKDAVAMQGGKT